MSTSKDAPDEWAEEEEDRIVVRRDDEAHSVGLVHDLLRGGQAECRNTCIGRRQPLIHVPQRKVNVHHCGRDLKTNRFKGALVEVVIERLGERFAVLVETLLQREKLTAAPRNRTSSSTLESRT